MHSICNGTIRWQIPDILSDGSSNVYSISHHLRDIRQHNKMSTFFIVKMKVKVKD